MPYQSVFDRYLSYASPGIAPGKHTKAPLYATVVHHNRCGILEMPRTEEACYDKGPVNDAMTFSPFQFSTAHESINLSHM